jgi:hypothetical protein
MGNGIGWFRVSVIEVIALRQGAFSVAVTASYSLMVGVILNSLKLYLRSVLKVGTEYVIV